MDPRLLSAIGTLRIQSQACDLVGLALFALDDLKRLDESLYERFVQSRDVPHEPVANAASLRKLWDDTFRGLVQLLAFCRTLEVDQPPPAASDTSAGFDFGDLDESGPAVAESQLDLGSSDIGDLLEGIDEHVQVVGDAERWAKVREKVSSIEYGLRSQLTDATSRLTVALSARETNAVLGLLDDTQSSAGEGIHAVVAAVYEAFLPEVDSATVVPEYLTALGRALLVRRGLAELGTMLAPYNDKLQGADRTRHEDALQTIRDTMRGFVLSVVCRAMRAADRWQMVQFEQELAEQPVSAARLTSEGLVKYLDSLGSINQREVLLLHDQRTIEAMREALANARQLLDISPRTANEMTMRAFESAQQLRGHNPVTDQLIRKLRRTDTATATAAESHAFLEALEAVLASLVA